MKLSDATTRVLRRLAVGLIAGGGCLLVTASAAHADQTHSPAGWSIVDQRPTVTNSGTAAATTGSNKATGNTSDNSSADSNSSNGHAAIETGPAVAKGNLATTSVTQSAATSATHHGSSIIDQSANVTNRGVAVARTGNNGVTDDGSTGDVPLLPVSKVAAGSVTPLPTSSGGTTPTVPLSGTRLGSSLTGSTAPLGAGPLGTHVPSPLTADVTSTPADPLATVPDRSNRVMGAVSGAGPPPDILTGPATAYGNQATTDVSQMASASGDGIALIDQPVLVSNIGSAIAATGHNDSSSSLSTGNATAIGDRALVTASQLAATPVAGKGTITNVGQGISATGLGSAHAATGNNSVKSSEDDGKASIDTGGADALGTDVVTDISQAST